ncbi:putative nuclease HARBI1 [Ruditapes philippinarum]|uniref:putative nuclease HARBI1 n=1 Tax=Ruditapes philippinarum TaxID=129788 RepID=UPI00295BD429|nr:putative nuclease HARBI1 [Ruditapes philippinarum]
MAALLLAVALERRRRGTIPQVRVFRDRENPLDFMDDVDLIKKYRMNRNAIYDLCEALNNDLSRPTKRSNALPVSLQVLMALRYYATGSFQSVVGDGYSVSSMSVSRCVRDVSYFITRRLQNEIKFPLLDEQQRLVKQGFYEIAQFPHVLGTVDGTLVPIRAPHDDEHIYVTRKGFHALNIQGISDSNNMLLNLVVRWPGSTHDAFILANSGISEEFESGRIQHGWLLGDSAYPLKTWLLTPISAPRDAAERRYNFAHKRTRCTVERTFGIWKMRFRCLHKSGGYLSFSPARCVNVIMATGILHNICTRKHIPLPDDTDEDDSNQQAETENENEQEQEQEVFQDGRQARADLINRVFR